MKNADTAVTNSLQYLERTIEEFTRAGVERLPTIKHLASRLHVSHATMNAAVRILRDRGVLVVSRKHGIRIANSRIEPPAVSGEKARWKQIRVRLECDTLRGMFHRELPRLSDLGERYGVGFRTVKQAVEALAADTGMVAVYKKRYRIVPARGPHPAATVLFVSRGDQTGKNLVFFSDRVREFDYSLVKECRGASLNLVKVAMPADTAERDAPRLLDRLYAKHAVIGQVIWRDCFPPALFSSVLRTCVSHRTPSAVIDETGDYFPRGTKGVRSFTIASAAAGRSVARYLLDNGHRRIAFVSIAAEAPWSVSRLRGIVEAFANAGRPDAVSRFCATAAISENDLAAVAFKKECDKIDGILYNIRVRSDQASRAYLTYEMFLTMRAMIENAALFKALDPWMTAIAADSAVTALVAATDALSILALDYCRKVKKRVPEDIAIIGFDDTRQAHEFGLSSYNFNFADMARLAMHYILDPKREMFARQEVIECEGLVMERGSTGGKR
jgi:DNA-binding LacI/PurR family transcriptional regulator/DNA-binding transcriptional regulator YhcF (GntR family)